MGQAGHFTSKQAEAAGYSRRLQHYHAHKGHWDRIDRGIYRLREFPTSPHEDLVRWVLWSNGKAVFSHDTAATVLELGDILHSRIHVTVEPGFRKVPPPSVVVHKAHLPITDIQDGPYFHLTTPLRTLVDLFVAHSETDRLVTAIWHSFDQGIVQRDAFRRALAALGEGYREEAQRLLGFLKRPARRRAV